ncbi:hypothetical protein [Vibrio cyclitrophicus]
MVEFLSKNGFMALLFLIMLDVVVVTVMVAINTEAHVTVSVAKGQAEQLAVTYSDYTSDPLAWPVGEADTAAQVVFLTFSNKVANWKRD